MYRFLLIILLVPSLFLAGCIGNNSSNEHNTQSNGSDSLASQYFLREGFIVDLDLENKRVFVVGEITEDDVKNRSVDEILSLVEHIDGYPYIWFTVNEKQLNELKIGDKVYVEYQFVTDSDPSKAFAEYIEVINDYNGIN